MNIENEIARRFEEIRKWVSKRVQNTADVEDLTQETILRALARKDTIRGNVGGFMQRIAMSVVADHFAAAGREVQLDIEPEAPASPAPAGKQVDRKLWMRRLRNASRGLPRSLAWAKLHYVDGVSQKEIAAREGVTANTVKQALKWLRERALARSRRFKR